MKNIFINSVIFVSGLGAAGMAAALSGNATSDINGVVVDPFTSQTVNVWKRGGYIRIPGDTGLCSATQIHPNWIMTARHCQPSTHQFHSPSQVSSSTSALTTCYLSSEEDDWDLAICRLANPEMYNAAAPYPVLSSSPPVLVDTLLSGSYSNHDWTRYELGNNIPDKKYGHFMAMGWGGEENNYLQFADNYSRLFDYANIDQAEWPFLMSYSEATILSSVGGDSGGGLFWMHSTQQEPVLIGHLRGAVPVVSGATKLTPEAVSWIANTIASAGDLPPTTTQWQDLYNGNTSHLPPDLPQPPSIITDGSTAVVTWNAPVPRTPNQLPIASYTLFRGIKTFIPSSSTDTPRSGRLDARINNIPSTTNTFTFTGIPNEKYYSICAMPVDSIGQLALGNSRITSYTPHTPTQAAPSPHGFKVDWLADNCITIDTRFPAAVEVGWAQRNIIGSTSRLLTASWVLPLLPDVPVEKYKVTRVVRYSTGPIRTTIFEQSSTSTNISVEKGTTVCVTVQSISKFGPRTSSSTQCRTAN